MLKLFSSFVITLKSANKTKEWEEPKERGRVRLNIHWAQGLGSQDQAEKASSTCCLSPSLYTWSGQRPKAEFAGKGRSWGSPDSPRLTPFTGSDLLT